MKKLLLSLILPVALLSCGDGNEYTLSGTIKGSDSEKLSLERPVSGMWLTVDSIETDRNGTFEISKEAPSHPEVLRLGRNGKYIYFPVDSIETVKIESDTIAFDTNYRLSGSADAVWMMQVDSITRSIANKSADTSVIEAAKKDLANRILQDPASIVAYYTVNKLVDNQPLFSMTSKADVRVIGAVANAYHTYKPNDPRTELLKAMFFAGRKNTVAPSAPKDTIYADQTQYININLFDKNGKQTKLSDVVAKRKVILLNFTTYLADESPALNAGLASLYKQHAANGFEIFQVCYDDNEFNWKTAAKNLPWISVYDPQGVTSDYLLKYNVGSLPAMFIINRNGELCERITDLKKIDSTVAKYM